MGKSFHAVLTITTILVVMAFVSCGGNGAANPKMEEGNMKLTSTAFKDGEMMAVNFGYEYENISPGLAWEGIPEDTKSLAIICTDPDAPGGEWTHWVVWGILPVLKSLDENQPKTGMLVNGASQGINDFGQIGWDGPSPPSGTHRYVFTLNALDVNLWHDKTLVTGKSNYNDLKTAMQNHIIKSVTLIGLFSK